MKFLALLFTLLFSLGSHAQRVVEADVTEGIQTYRNYVKNPSARRNAAFVVTNDATATRDTDSGDAIDGGASWLCDASADGGYCEWTLNTIQSPDTSGNCKASLVYKGDATLYRLQILDGSSNLLHETLNLQNVTEYSEAALNYPCGSSRKVRLTQRTAGTAPAVNVGRVYYGKADNIGTVTQAQVVVRARGVPTGPLDGSGATIWGTEDEDIYGAYNASTGQFTAPFGGRFCWNAAVKLTGTEASDNYITLTPYIGTSAQSAYNGLYRLEGTGLTDQQVQTSACLALTAGQVLTFRTETNIGSAAFGSASSNYLVIRAYPEPSQVIATANLPRSPTVTRLTSGSGTYTPPTGVSWLEIEMVGGGGGGGGSGTSVTGGDGGDGTASTFGTSLLTAPRGLGGAKSGSAIGGSSGGAATANAPAVLVYAHEGERASAGFPGGISYMPGGNGGSSFFGGAGVGIFDATAGPARANSGSGGAGGGTGSDSGPGGAGGGGAGTYLRARIPPGSVAASYAYTVGDGGAGGTAGTSGFAGGAGASGIIIITEHYNTDNMPLYVGSVKTNSSGVTTVSANTPGGVLAFSDASTITPVTGTQHQVLRMGATNPEYGALALNQSAAVTGTLPVANGGTGYTGGAWTTWVPSVSISDATSPVAVNVGGAYLQIGKLVSFWVVIQYTYSGTATGLTFTLPSTALSSTGIAQVFAGRNTSSGDMLQAVVPSGSSTVTVLRYDNATPLSASNDLIAVSGTYQAN